MTLEKIKDDLEEKIGKKVKVKFNLGRNKVEEYEAIIKAIYNYIFIVNTGSEDRSFTYSDVLTKTVELNFY